MFKEYAIEPEILFSYANLQRISENFGFDKGRMLSSFPGSWARQVLQNLQVHGPIQKKRAVEYLKLLKMASVKSRRDYDSNNPWIINAIKIQNTLPFDGVVHLSEIDEDIERFLYFSDMDFNREIMKCDTSCSVVRKPESIFSCVENLVQGCKSFVKLIDPHFRPSEPRWKQSFSYYIRRIFEINDKASIEIHAKRPNQDKDFIEFHDWERICGEIVDSDCNANISIYRWKQREGSDHIHDRFILTEKGGVSVSSGLDKGDYGELTLVSILSTNDMERLLSQYRIPAIENNTFDFVDLVEINS